MRRKLYSKLTYENAEWAAYVYMRLASNKCPVVRTTDIEESTRSSSYKKTLQALHRLHDNGIVDCRQVGDAGNVWWLTERLK